MIQTQTFIASYDDLLLKYTELSGKRLRIEILSDANDQTLDVEEGGIPLHLIEMIETSSPEPGKLPSDLRELLIGEIIADKYRKQGLEMGCFRLL